jgi:tetratricopeptide (TPR) repeat protein
MPKLFFPLALLLFSTSAAAQDDGALRADLLTFFKELGRGIEQRDSKAIQACLDAPRMIELLKSEGVTLSRHARSGIRPALARSLASGWYGFGSAKLELRSVEALPDGEFRVVAGFYGGDADTWDHVRWWLTRVGGKLRAYDWQQLGTYHRRSQWMRAAFSSSAAQKRDLGSYMRGMLDFHLALLKQDFDRAGAQLDMVNNLALPDFFRAVYLVNLSKLLRLKGEPEGALAAAKRSLILEPDLPETFLGLTLANQDLGRHKEALACIRRYQDLLGADSNSDLVLGQVLSALDRTDEAWSVFQRGLDDAPGSRGLLVELALGARGEAQFDILRVRFRRFEPAYFDELGSALLKEEGLPGLRVLCAELDRQHPDDPNVEYYLAEALAFEGDHQGAAELLLQALPRSGEERGYYLENFLDYGGVKGPGPVWAYEQVPADGLEAFERLAGELADAVDPGPFDQLATRHAAAHPQDPRLPFHRARRWREAKDHGRAETLFAAAAALATGKDRDEVLEWRVDNLVVAGRTAEAMALEPRDPAWHWVVDSCVLWEEGDVLLEAIELRRAQAPEEAELDVLTGLARWYQGKDAAAAEYLVGADLNTVRLALLGYGTELEQARVRAGVRCGRARELLGLVREDSPLLRLIVHAHLEDVGATVQAVERCLEAGWDKQSLLDDEDLGSRLARPETAAALGWE